MKLDHITVNLHSFVDLITNSSTEIFVEASQSTIDAVKEVVDNLLEVAGSDLKADDLFEFELGEKEGWDYYVDRSLKVTAKNPDCERTAKILSNLTGLFGIDAVYNG